MQNQISFISSLLHESCYPQEIFINENQIKKFLCPIDLGVCRNPVLDECGHSYGKVCIELCLLKKKFCPLTNLPYSEPLKLTDNLMIKEFINELEIKCLNFTDNCEWKGTIETLSEHLKNECKLVEINCEMKECDKKFKRWEKELHYNNECFFYPKKCIFFENCGELITINNTLEHIIKVHKDQFWEYIENYSKINERNEILTKEKNIILEENSKLKEENSNLQKNIQEYKVENDQLNKDLKLAYVKILEEETKYKLLEDSFNKLSKEKEDVKISEEKTIDINMSLIKKEKEINDIKNQKETYNYPCMNYNPITGQELFSSMNNVPVTPIDYYSNIKEKNINRSQTLPMVLNNSIQSSFIDYQEIIAHTNIINTIIYIDSTKVNQYLATCSQDRTIKIWKIEDLSLICQLIGHEHDVNKLIFIKNRQYLISASHDGSIKVWNVENWICIKTIEMHKGKCRTINFLEKQNLIISGGSDFKLNLWSFDSNKPYNLLLIENEISEILVIESDGPGNDIIFGDQIGNIYHINYDQERKTSYFSFLENKILNKKKIHFSVILKIIFIKSRGLLASCAAGDPSIKFFDLKSFNVSKTLNICDSQNGVNDLVIYNNLYNNLVIATTSSEKIFGIGIDSLCVEKVKEKEGVNINSVCIFGNNVAYAGTCYKDLKYMYLVRIRRNFL